MEHIALTQGAHDMTTYTIPTYEVAKRHRNERSQATWILRRVDQVAHIGIFKTRREAINAGRMLAGWRGQVLLSK
jgi:hypothetical protein